MREKFLIRYSIILTLILLGLGIFYGAQTFGMMRDNQKPNLVKGDPYILRENATETQQKIHDELMSAEENNNELLLVQKIAESYIADYYTWTNKYRSNDVGGIEWIHPNFQSSFYQKSMKEFYANLSYYIDLGNLEETLSVDQVYSKISKTNIEFNDKNVEGYLVTVSWNYEPSKILDIERYQSEAELILLNESGNWYIVEVRVNEKDI